MHIPHVLWSLSLVSQLCTKVGAVSAIPQKSLASIIFDGISGQLERVQELHQVGVSIEGSLGHPDTNRHHDERRLLLRRLKRSHGTWDTNHPRYRLLQALYSFRTYHSLNNVDLQKWKDLYKQVGSEHQKVLEKEVHYSQKFNDISKLLVSNQALCDDIIQNSLEFYGIQSKEFEEHVRLVEAVGGLADKVAVSQTLKHFVRDWTESGMVEREATYPCVLQTLENLLIDRKETHAAVRILVPGSGQGRLGHEIAKIKGVEVTINEWSAYMNVAYRYLERHRQAHQQSVHPFLDDWSHHISTANMLRSTPFPDVDINATSVVLIEGDFTTVLHNHVGYFDVVVTHFFIDTARNLMTYLETIAHVLANGGHWVNAGPLLYGSGPFVQLALDEILVIMEAMGFQFLDLDEEVCGDVTIQGKKVRGREARYGFDDRALNKKCV